MRTLNDNNDQKTKHLFGKEVQRKGGKAHLILLKILHNHE